MTEEEAQHQIPAQPGTEAEILQRRSASNRPPVQLYADAGEIRAALREIRGELAEIRARLDSLVGIEKQLGYQAQRMAALEKRLTALVEMKVNPPVPPTAFQSSPGPAG